VLALKKVKDSLMLGPINAIHKSANWGISRGILMEIKRTFETPWWPISRVPRYLPSARVSLKYTRVTTYDEGTNLVDSSARLVSFYIQPCTQKNFQ